VAKMALRMALSPHPRASALAAAIGLAAFCHKKTHRRMAHCPGYAPAGE